MKIPHKMCYQLHFFIFFTFVFTLDDFKEKVKEKDTKIYLNYY